MPLLSNANPNGWFNPELTKVNTTPFVVILLIVLFPELAQYKLPKLSNFKEKGLNIPPTNIDTTPTNVILLIELFPKLEQYKL